jgi:hypothetical protein
MRGMLEAAISNPRLELTYRIPDGVRNVSAKWDRTEESEEWDTAQECELFLTSI